MKNISIKEEIKKLTDDELEQRLISMQETFFRFCCKNSAGNEINVARNRELKRNISRILAELAKRKKNIKVIK